MIREQGGHSVEEIDNFRKRLLQAKHRRKQLDQNEL